ncbi:uncharacterized protein LOC124279610 [Haliotis rubra]|uniref:uncharacterized protein LOC124279610 n=1 Tax=Haliotis rubra TaxID=36100 RepID=UPI001EE5E60C|nr:uncharacterized protein LOC124279610 [Haliotis rubra]
MPKRGQKSAVSLLEKLEQTEVKDNQEKVEISEPDGPSVPDVPSVPGLPSVPDLPSVLGLPSVPDLPSVPGLQERSQSRERLKSGKVRKNLSFLGEASLPLGDRSGEVTLDGLSDGEDRSVESGQMRQDISHGRAVNILRLPSFSEDTESILTRNLSPQFVPNPPDSTHLSDSYCGPPATPMTPDSPLGEVSFSPRPQPIMTPESVNVVLPQVIHDEDDLDIRSYMGESDSGMDSEFISVSQRGMYLTETEISEWEEEERVIMAGMLSDPGKISLKQRPASSFIDRPEYVQDSRF